MKRSASGVVSWSSYIAITDKLAFLVRESEVLTLEELGRYLGRDANGLGRQAARLSAKSAQLDVLQHEISEIRLHILQMSECPA